MDILIIHHFEREWERGYARWCQTMEDIAEQLLHHLLFDQQYDKVILTQFNFNDMQDEIYHMPLCECGEWYCDCSDSVCLADFIDEVHEYGYGWEVRQLDHVEDLGLHRYDRDDNWAGWTLLGRGKTWDWGGYHSEVVILDQWMFDLKGHDISLCGAFDGECIEDMEYALESVGVEFDRLEALIL